MSDNDSTLDKFLNAYTIIVVACMFIGAIGFAVHSLIILPVKFYRWVDRDDRSHPDNLLNMSKLNAVMLGVAALAIPAYIVECVVVGNDSLEWYHHAILVSFLLIPLRYVATETYKEFTILTEPIGDPYYLSGSHWLGLVWRFVAGIIIAVGMGISVYDVLTTP